jgi:glycine betaine transporter
VYGIVPTTTTSLVILAVVTVSFLVSASTGLDKGIQILSNVNMTLAIGLLLFVALTGPTSYVMEGFVNVLGDYMAALPSYAFRLLSYEDQMGWSSAWTLTYLVWWVAWGPFVGIFIARISRGRTIREFCGGVILVPAVFSLFWFAALGGTSLWIELSGGGGLSELVHEDTAKALFAFLSYLPQPQLVSTIAVLLVFIFLVTSADSATFVVSMMTSEGSLEPKRSLKLLWGGAITLITVAVLVSGSVEVAKAMAVFGAVPFTLILVFQIVAFLRALRLEKRGRP